MKKIGVTSAGTVIVEMSAAQFDALMQIHTPQAPQQPPPAQPPPTAPAAPTAGKDSVASMTLQQLIDYVAKRIGKLKPKRKDALIHSIETMFKLTGGIDTPTIERVIAGLEKSTFITIDAAGKVTYQTP
jgi:hypothetical protein